MYPSRVINASKSDILKQHGLFKNHGFFKNIGIILGPLLYGKQSTSVEATLPRSTVGGLFFINY